MINMTMWQCPPGLIEQALEEHPISNEVTVLNIPTGNFFYDSWTLKDEFKDTLWEQVLDTLPYTIGEARIITLTPGESYMAHADIDNRWHLNLTGEQSYLIDLDNQKMYKQRQDSHWRYMFADNIHTANNFGSIDRLQLVVREPLKHSIFPNLTAVTITPAYEQADYRYQFDNSISPWLNKKNQASELDHFAFNDNVVSFSIAEQAKQELEQFDKTRFTITYA